MTRNLMTVSDFPSTLCTLFKLVLITYKFDLIKFKTLGVVSFCTVSNINRFLH